MTTNPHLVPLGREDAVFIRDVLDLTSKYLRNRWRDPALAPGIALAAADGARALTRHLDEKKDH
ncbi:hypothetical protein KDL01_18050 [Actinospica durhamensis]|uniref:Uncharacterized protein n=1 Tax=Actinospica durhamensis TaxID=1508375 RepID=A0A941IU67_9ACTN|nr:hypothetical protein [Actinospica durhamensis]MBR7835181.1 hypothetical protein [Actinospica durhamensis]